MRKFIIELRWNLGIYVLKFGYWLRGDVPQRHWFNQTITSKHS